MDSVSKIVLGSTLERVLLDLDVYLALGLLNLKQKRQALNGQLDLFHFL